jgi:transcriptional regulator with XRE-family HTH domain
MKDIYKQVAANIKRVRLHRGLTQAQAAVICKMNENHFAKVERGSKSTLATYEKIARGLKLKSSDIFPF